MNWRIDFLNFPFDMAECIQKREYALPFSELASYNHNYTEHEKILFHSKQTEKVAMVFQNADKTLLCHKFRI